MFKDTNLPNQHFQLRFKIYGTVGRVVDFYSRGLQFKTSHQQLIHIDKTYGKSYFWHPKPSVKIQSAVQKFSEHVFPVSCWKDEN